MSHASTQTNKVWKGGYGWKPSSRLNFQIRAFRVQISQFELCELVLLLKLYKKLPVEQFEASRAIRGSSISVSSTLPPSSESLFAGCAAATSLSAAALLTTRAPCALTDLLRSRMLCYVIILVYLHRHTYIHTYIHTCIHIYIYIYTHTM